MKTLARMGTVVGLCGFVVGCNPCCGDPTCGKSTSGGGTTTNTTTTTTTTTTTPEPPPVRTTPVHNQGPRNGLRPCALWNNRDLLQVLRSSELTTSTMNRPEVQSRLADEDTRGLLQYIVSCANDPSAPIVSPTLPAGVSPTDKYAPPWPGEMGLCGSSSPWPWSASGAPKDCQEAVSACVLARVNKVGMRVVISTRGEPSNLFPLLNEIPVETVYRDGQKAPSTMACSPGVTNCGFTAKRVGVCSTGGGTSGPVGPNGRTMVTLTPAPSVSGGEVRVCAGLYACHPGDIGQRYYSEHIADSPTGSGGTLTFECPGNGPRVGGTSLGYYSVLTRGGAFDVTANKGSYPGKETEVFTYREGAFFGNLFNTSQLVTADAPNPCAEPDKALGGHEFACFSEIWSNGLAHYNDRWCAGTACFVNTPVPCLFQANTSALAADRACVGQSAAPQPFYKGGRGGRDDPANFRWQHPITVYLNHPCDTVSDKTGSCAGMPDSQ